jgi:RimJ/RimL family protein N-acetyltransferase
MTELTNKNITLKAMSQKELRALWRKYEPAPDSGEKQYVYNEEIVDAAYERIVERAEAEPTMGIFTRNNEIVGMVVVERIVVSEKRCELRIMIANEAHRNKGIGTEALLLVKKYIKETLGLTRIYADVSTNNPRMQAVLKKCGFMHTKTFKGNYPDGGDRMSYVCVM